MDLFFVVRHLWLLPDEGIVLQPGTALVLLDEFPNLALVTSADRKALKLPKFVVPEEAKFYLHGWYTQQQFEQGLYHSSIQSDTVFLTPIGSTIGKIVPMDDIESAASLLAVVGDCLLTPIEGRWYAAEEHWR